MKFLHILVFVVLCEAFPKNRRHAGLRGNVDNQHVVGSADPRLAQAFRSLPNVRQVNAPANRVDMFGTVDPANPPHRPAYTHGQGALEVTGGIVNIRGGMVNAVGGVVNVVGARINRIPAPVYAANNQPTYGVRTSGRGNTDGRRIGTLTLNENTGIVNSNDSTVTIVGGTVNLFEGYSVNDPNLPPAFTTAMKTDKPGAGIAVDSTNPPATVAAQTSVLTSAAPPTTTTTAATTTTATTTTTAPITTTTTQAPTTTPEPTTLSPVDEHNEELGPRKPMVKVADSLFTVAEHPLQTASAIVATSFFGFAVILCGICVLTRANRRAAAAAASISPSVAYQRRPISALERSVSQLGLRRDIPLSWRS